MPEQPPSPRAPSTPLRASMLFTFLSSSGTYVVESGIFFLTKQTYRFTDAENYALGVILGVTYIAGALLAQKVVEAARARLGWSSRDVLRVMMWVMAALCLLPLAMRLIEPAPGEGGRPATWPIWVLVGLYSPLTGVLWPMVESYVSGGLREDRLRDTIGWWNVVWSSALIVAAVAMAPLAKARAAELIAALSVVHLWCAWVLSSFAPEPDQHVDDHEVFPPVYRQLLVTFRLLLPLSYLVSSALMPYLPTLTLSLGVSERATTIVGGTWVLSRTIVFYWMLRRTGWHGRWWLAGAGGSMLLVGFGAAVLSARVASAMGLGQGAGLGILIAGLSVFGAGMAMIYAGAIYYAMEVGSAEVHAGGKHEALIGVGYAGGPGLGLAAGAAVSAGAMHASWFEGSIFIAIAIVGAVVAGLVAWRISTLGRAAPGVST